MVPGDAWNFLRRSQGNPEIFKNNTDVYRILSPFFRCQFFYYYLLLKLLLRTQTKCPNVLLPDTRNITRLMDLEPNNIVTRFMFTIIVYVNF